MAAMAVPLGAQQKGIRPDQIQPSNSNSQVITTTGCPGACKAGWQNSAAGGVNSFDGRTGAVVPQTGDYGCSQVTGAVCSLPAFYYQNIWSNSTPMTQRPTLNLIPGILGAVNCADNAVTNSTDCTITGAGAPAGVVAVTDVTGSRALGTTYRNANAYPLLVTVSGSMFLGVGHTSTIQARIGASFPSMNYGTSSIMNSSGTTALTFEVPAGYFYAVYTSVGLPGETNPASLYSWIEATQPFGGITTAVPFSIASFTGAQAGELGQSFVNPAFAATYSATPASAQIANTDGIDSPHVLTTPFTSATLSGTFSHSSIATTTFTLSATQGTTQTATQSFTWQPRIFAGLGAPGATSTVTASGTTAVLSTSDVLASAGLGAETVGQALGSYEPSAQNIYLLLTGSSHTFTDACTGFPLPFNAPIAVSFVNQYGVTVSMFLYASTNPLTFTGGCAFTPRVAS